MGFRHFVGSLSIPNAHKMLTQTMPQGVMRRVKMYCRTRETPEEVALIKAPGPYSGRAIGNFYGNFDSLTADGLV